MITLASHRSLQGTATAIAAVAASLVAGRASAQVSFQGSYTQHFDGLGQSGTATLTGIGPHVINGVLGATGLDGWFAGNFGGSSTNTEFKAHDGSLASSAGRGVVSFGTTGSSERALGGLSTSNQIPGFGVVLTNDSNRTLVDVTISYTGEQWRAGDANIADVLNFRYGFGASLTDATTAFAALNFATPVVSGGNIALNGNLPANQTQVSATITGIEWAPGESIVLRWDAIDLSGQDNGLAIDDLSVVGTPKPITSLNLANYELCATHALPGTAAAEASAVSYDWDTGTLFVLGDEGDALVEVSLTGELLGQMTLTGFDDTEGLTYIGEGTFVIVEERLQDVYLIEYVAGGSVDRSILPSVSLGDTVGNIGLEGISYDPIGGGYVTVKEKSPQGVFQAELDWSGPAGSMTSLFTPRLGVLDLSDVAVLTTVPSLVGTSDEDNLLLFSQESAILLEVTPSGTALSSFSFGGIATDAEGVTIGPDGTIYVVGETPSLYVLCPLEVACPADLNGDGSVGADDLATLLGAWSNAGASDLDGSGTVDSADLAILLGAWGNCS